MKMQEFLVAIIVFAAVVLLLTNIVKKMKDCGCGDGKSDCHGKCDGCSSDCPLCNNTRQDEGE